MSNPHQTLQPGEAVLRYMDAEFRVLREGAFVRCAATGAAIPLQDLRYWDVARQVPFGSAAAAFARREDGV